MLVVLLQVRALPVMIDNDLAYLDSDSSDDSEAVGDLPAGPRVEGAAQLTSAAMVRRSCRRLVDVGVQTLQGRRQITAGGQPCNCKPEARHHCRMQRQQLAFESAVLQLTDL